MVTIAGYELLVIRIIFEKSYLLLEGILITFVE